MKLDSEIQPLLLRSALSPLFPPLCPPRKLGGHFLLLGGMFNFFLKNSVSCVEKKMDSEFQPPSLPGSASSPPCPPRKLRGHS